METKRLKVIRLATFHRRFMILVEDMTDDYLVQFGLHHLPAILTHANMSVELVSELIITKEKSSSYL